MWRFLSGVHTHTPALRRLQNICRSFWIGFSSFLVARTMLRVLRFRFIAQRVCAGAMWAHRTAEREPWKGRAARSRRAGILPGHG